MSALCEVRRFELVTYENGMAMQERLVSLRQRAAIPDQLLLLEHPPVITLGRGGDRSNLLVAPESLEAAGVRFHETTRGGDITYHGPGQIVGYPIIHMGEGRRDVRKYVTGLEEVLIRTLAEYDITAERREGSRGVWVGNDKIAALGVRVARWVTSHGFALNVSTNLDHFRFITPCGIRGAGVTSIERLLRRSVERPDVEERLLKHFAYVFERELRWCTDIMEVVTVQPYDGEKMLLLHRPGPRGFWQPVTGCIEPGERSDRAAARELFEETGFRAPVRPLGLRQAFLIDPSYAGAEQDELIFAVEESFAAEVDASRPVHLDPEEHDDSGWFSFDEALKKVHWSDDRETLERLRTVILSRGAAKDLYASAAPSRRDPSLRSG